MTTKKLRLRNRLLVLLVSFLVGGCGDQQVSSTVEKNPSAAAARVYHNGPVITMASEVPTSVEALVEQDGNIAFVGSLDEAKAVAGEDAEFVDLQGATVLPGLIEPHLHPSLAAVMLQNEIIAPYDWNLPSGLKQGVSGQDNYRARISQSIQANARPGELYFIWGFHQLWHGSLSRELLNEIAGDQPVGIIHRSFHEIYLNDAAIELLGIAEQDFVDNPQVDWAKGHFYEGGWLALVPAMAPVLLEPEKYRRGLAVMTEILQQNGITTIAEPGFPSSDFEVELSLLKGEMAKNPPYDVYLIPSGTQLYSMKGGNQEAMAFIETLATAEDLNSQNVRFLPKQVKLFADGAIYSADANERWLYRRPRGRMDDAIDFVCRAGRDVLAKWLQNSCPCQW